MKHTKKRVAALLLTLAMVLSLMPMAFAADEYPDGMPAEDDASYAAVKSAVDNGIISGQDGNLNLEGNIIRSTMAAMVTRTFGAKGETTMTDYSDVDDSHWAVKQGALPAAVQMGIMNGSNGKMLPDENVTREQAWAMLARALKLEKGTAADLEGIPGTDSLSAWAIPEIASLVKAGYISDVSGATEPMTRVEFAEVIYTVSGGNYVKEGGEYTEDVDGNIIITADGVSLKGITVKGDVIIADGVDAGSINLDGVTIEGRLLVRGGSEVALTNGTTAASTVVAKTSDEVTVSADKASDAGSITVDAKADKVTVNMPEPAVTVISATEIAVQNAEGGSVTLQASGASLSVESGTVANVTVADGASDVKVDVAEGATIEMVSTNTDITITGEGTVEEKEGSGTVTDAEGNEVGGSDEPVVVPIVDSTAPTTAEGPTQTAHTHNYSTTAVYFDSSRHTYTCVNKLNADGETVGYGCGAVIYENHSYSIACKPNGAVGTDEENTTFKCVCNTVKPASSTLPGSEPDGQGTNYTCGGTHGNWKLNENAVGSEPTCTTPGEKYYVCGNLDNEGHQCTATQTVTTPATGHNYALTSSTVNCGGGVQTYTCTQCEGQKTGTDAEKLTADLASGHVKQITVTAGTVAHTYTTSVVTTAATHTAKGVRTWTCSVCHGTTTEEIAKTTAHTWVYAEGTEENAGKHVGTCACGETQIHAPALAASWTTSAAQHWHVCTVAGCGLTSTKEDHDYDGGNACRVCSDPKPAPVEPGAPEHEHSKGETVKYNDDQHWFCCDGKEEGCEDQKYEAANHNFGSNATVPDGKCTGCDKTHTCDNSNDTTVPCSKCGYKTTSQELD